MAQKVKTLPKPKENIFIEDVVLNDLDENIFGARKYFSKLWLTVAYFIPRSSLFEAFADEELQNNSIYFLCGNIDGVRKIYVGKAGKRLDGESVLQRLREHDKSKTEWYREVWDSVIVLTTLNDSWDATEIETLEHKFYNIIPQENRLNDKIPTPGTFNNNTQFYNELVNQGKSFLYHLGIKLFKQEIVSGAVTEITATYRALESKDVKNLQKNRSKIPDITTPVRTVKEMVDLLPDSVWHYKTKFLDMSCKGGEFLEEIYNRLFNCASLKAKYPNEAKRSLYIINKQLYGIALTRNSFNTTSITICGEITENNNIRVLDSYIDIIRCYKKVGKYKYPVDETVKQLFDRTFTELNEEGEKKPVEFNVIIGNPPYNDEKNNGGAVNQQSSDALYQHFVEAAKQLNPEYSSFIIPCRWFTEDNAEYKNIRNILLSDNTRVIHDYPDAKDVFNGVSITGGVCYYLSDKNYHGDCEFHSHEKNKDTISNVKLSSNEIFIRNEIMRRVVSKVKAKNEITMDTIVSTTAPFGFKRADRGAWSPTEYANIKLFAADKFLDYTYVSLDQIKKNQQWVPKYKVYAGYTQALNDGELSSLGILKPNEICTLTYIILDCFDTEIEAENCLKYMKTRFARALLKCVTTTLGVTAKNYANIPLQNFTTNSDIDWSKSITNIDQQLYKKYGLTTEEIQYIESTVKSMDTKPKYTGQDAAAAYVNQLISNQNQ